MAKTFYAKFSQLDIVGQFCKTMESNQTAWTLVHSIFAPFQIGEHTIMGRIYDYSLDRNSLSTRKRLELTHYVSFPRIHLKISKKNCKPIWVMQSSMGHKIAGVTKIMDLLEILTTNSI